MVPPHTVGSAATTAGCAHPGRVLAGALAGRACCRRRWRRGSSCEPPSSELLPSDDPGVVALTKTQKRMGDLSLLLIGVRSPDYAGQPALRRGADAEAARACPPTVVSLATYHVRDVRDFFERNKWLYVVGGGPRDRSATGCAPRSASARTRCSCRWATTNRSSRCGSGMAGKRRPRRALPGRRVHQQGRRVRLDRGAAPGRPVRRERGRGAVQRAPTS